MFRGCTPSPDLKIILETTILSISRGLPRLREIKKEKDDIAANRWREPLLKGTERSVYKTLCPKIV